MTDPGRGSSRWRETAAGTSPTVAGPALRPGEFVPLIALLMALVALATDTMLPALPAIGPRTSVRHDRTTSSSWSPRCSWGSESARSSLRSALRPHRTQARHPCRSGGVHGRVPGVLLRVHVRGDDRGSRPAGHRRRRAEDRDRGLVRDQYEGRRMARLMSFALAVFILVPTIAPSIGQVDPVDRGLGARYSRPSSSSPRSAWRGLRYAAGTLPLDRRRPFTARVIGGGRRWRC